MSTTSEQPQDVPGQGPDPMATGRDAATAAAPTPPTPAPPPYAHQAPAPGAPPLWAPPAPYGATPPFQAQVPPPPGPGDPLLATVPTQGRSRARQWGPIGATALAAALVASLATAGLTGAFSADGTTTPSSLATIGEVTSSTVPVSGSTSDQPDWEAVATAVRSSVVAIDVTTASGSGKGSGVVIDAKGHVLTNNHVVGDAVDGGLQVTLADGRVYEATVVGTDPTTDLAVIALTDPPTDLSPAVLGSSADVAVGSAVMAVGNPLGLDTTVTTGIVSAVDRPVSTSDGSDETVVTNAIQIDAAINPGNSGGPLFDASGKVIGITSSIASLSSSSSSAGSIGLGFAIPVDLADRIAAELIADGSAEHAFLGVGLTDGTATADGTTRRGAVVKEVSDSSPASEAKLQVDDVVVAFNGNPVNGAESLTAFVREEAAGSTATLTVVRDGKALDVKVTFAVRAEAASSSSGSSGSGGNG